jgi:hypothetical protein
MRSPNYDELRRGNTMKVGRQGAIPRPRTEARIDPLFSNLTLWSDGLVRMERTAPVDVEELVAVAADHVAADLQLRVRRLRDTREPFPTNPYRLSDELLDSGKLPFLPKNRDAGRELLARLYRDALHRALGSR